MDDQMGEIHYILAIDIDIVHPEPGRGGGIQVLQVILTDKRDTRSSGHEEVARVVHHLGLCLIGGFKRSE